MLDQTPTGPSPVPPNLTPPPRGRRRTPVDLWQAVLSARYDLALERAFPDRHRQPTAQVVLVGALEAYLLSLAERGHPVPYALRDEARLHRLTCTDRYGRRAAFQDGPNAGTQT
jgi:hypothetical protein